MDVTSETKFQPLQSESSESFDSLVDSSAARMKEPTVMKENEDTELIQMKVDESRSKVDSTELDELHKKEEEERILLQQANEKSRYEQLLILMQKSDLFVKMIFQRMEESKKAAESKISRLKKGDKNKSRKRQRKQPQKSIPKKRRRFANEVVTNAEVSDEEVDDSHEKIELFSGGSLRDYQVEGQRWLNNLYENGISGILADEMGLGKTVQVIAAIAKMIESGVRGPFMIVAPLSTLPNWANEFERFTPEIPVVLYHAAKDDRVELREKISVSRKLPGKLVSFPVLITSYDVISNDAKLLRWINWKMLCVDEGHRLKNHKCHLLKALKHIDCGHRLLLTGTPLQNSLSELWSLLNFILPEIFSDLKSFEEWFDHDSLSQESNRRMIIKQEKEKRVLGLMHQILTPFMLRRLKTDVDLTIPPKRETVIHAPLTEYQRVLYDNALDGSISKLVIKEPFADEDQSIPRSQRRSRFNVDYRQFDADDPANEEKFLDSLECMKTASLDEFSCVKEKPVPRHEMHIRMQNLMMITRRITNHAHQVEYPLDEEGEYCLDERLLKHSGKVQVLDILLRNLRAGGHKVLIFSQFTSMLDILQDYCNYVGYKYSRLDGAMKLEERKDQMKWFAEEEEIFIFLLSTRAGGLGLNLTAADTVIFYDSDWNPQQDIQAQDRCHRIGQTKPVLVFRLLIPDTIEDKMMRYARNKRTLERLIIHGECFKKSLESRDQWDDKKFQISDDKLMELLSSRDYQNSTVNLIDEESIKKHLDRTDLWNEWKKPKH